ncbi:MAG: very short patch repair endonuclease [Chloroflexia bacterium]
MTEADVRLREKRETRSRIMASVGTKDTKPELRVRSLLHRMGYRFRLNRRDLPGSPDIVLSKHRTVIFVHGCFWHRHLDCRKTTTPKDNAEFWQLKFERNIARDEAVTQALIEMGWRVVTVWQCEVEKGYEWLTDRLYTLLRSA